MRARSSDAGADRTGRKFKRKEGVTVSPLMRCQLNALVARVVASSIEVDGHVATELYACRAVSCIALSPSAFQSDVTGRCGESLSVLQCVDT